MEIKSPSVGKVLRLSIEAGAQVARGTELMVIESMKVEIPIKSNVAGQFERVSRQTWRSDSAQRGPRGG